MYVAFCVCSIACQLRVSIDVLSFLSAEFAPHAYTLTAVMFSPLDLKCPCNLERVTKSGLKGIATHLTPIKKEQLQLNCSKFLRKHRLIMATIKASKDIDKPPEPDGTLQNITQLKESLYLSRSKAQLIVAALCHPWGDHGAKVEKRKRQLTTAALFLSESVLRVTNNPRPMSWRTLQAAFKAASGCGHIFEENNLSHLAFCFGTIATHWRIDETNIVECAQSVSRLQW